MDLGPSISSVCGLMTATKRMGMGGVEVRCGFAIDFVMDEE